MEAKCTRCTCRLHHIPLKLMRLVTLCAKRPPLCCSASQASESTHVWMTSGWYALVRHALSHCLPSACSVSAPNRCAARAALELQRALAATGGGPVIESPPFVSELHGSFADLVQQLQECVNLRRAGEDKRSYAVSTVALVSVC